MTAPTGPEQRLIADTVAARPMAHALADAMQRWDDEGDDDATFEEAYTNGWSLSEFIALALVRDGWTFEKRLIDGGDDA